MTDSDHTKLTERIHVDSSLRIFILAAGVTVLIDTLGRWGLTAVGGTGLEPLSLLIILATIAVGAAARWGLVLGLLIVGLILGDWTGGVINAFAAVAAVTVCQRAWTVRDVSQWLGRYVVAAVSTTLAVAAATAWLSELLGVASFSVAVVPSLIGNLIPALVGAPIVWVVSNVSTVRNWRVERTGVSTRGAILTFGVLAVWVVGGYLGSFAYRAAGTVPISVFGQRLGRTAERIVVLAGPQGRYVILALGVGAVLALVLTFRYE